ncbi:MAG TPA: aldo/keto reductase [Usitatibacteraceae bacterium]|nr:aldo/keto reductase [Usitatibacteraceae bacterium]HQY46604.1 aldo/keto reductase [Usitatibacteraceae bacterium]HRA24069.1 aldo/keto reductase [Usitatibacteraceae bacterium]
MRDFAPIDRRNALQALAALAGAALLPVTAALAPVLERPIPATGERIPAIGMGTWLTFDVAPGADRDARLAVLREFFAGGGTLLDSSPMYGYAEAALGELVPKARPARVFNATKVWTPTRFLGVRQMEESFAHWGVRRFDLMQVHNMLDWETHLATLKEWKASGRIRYLGITTSHGRRHDALEAAMRRERLDFVQFSYSFADRDAEKRLLPLAQDRGAAVIVNRPFDGGALFGAVKGKALPGWARDIDCANWAQAFLKFVVSHPAVTCAIPATTSPAHMREDIGALAGRLPDAVLRRRMAADFDRL